MNQDQKTIVDDMQCCVNHCDAPLDNQYWNERWELNETGWDIGYPAPALTDYMKQVQNKDAAILIPGCGNAYEAQFLADHGFTNITLLDIAPAAVQKLQEKFADKPQVKIICADFFEHEGKYDIILEQTFFCAIPPHRREEFAKKAANLLNENGKLTGVLFDRRFEQQGPPFGGCPCEYKPVFEPFFELNEMDECYNSIPPRKGTEVFINFRKK